MSSSLSSPTADPSPSEPRAGALACYGALRMPLALLELPLFVVLPALYGNAGLSLAAVGLVLFAARGVDALADPFIGLRLARCQGFVHRRWILLALPVLATGFVALLNPPQGSATQLAIWLALFSIASYLAYSVASIAYQAWGTDLGERAAARARVTALREGFGLAGVLVAIVFLDPAQNQHLGLIFVVLTLISAALLLRAPVPPMASRRGGANSGAISAAAPATMGRVLANRAFRKLILIFLMNGVATAIPATLVLFFVRDVLHAESQTGLFLAIYFLAGALGLPFWALLARLLGLRLAWLSGMALAVAGFAWTLGLAAGDTTAFSAVCAVTGLALGADLVVPGALLAQVIAERGDRGAMAGAYVGCWNLATKATLAIAAGIALPLLDWYGYQPGIPGAALGLTLTYAALPCALKLFAAILLVFAPPEPVTAAPPC